MTREDAVFVLEDAGLNKQEIEALKFLLGEIRDLELEKNKLELDVGLWQGRAEQYKSELDRIGQMVMGGE